MKQFSDKRHLNKLNQRFKEHLSQHSWKCQNNILVETTRFTGIDRAEAGRNQVGTLMQLQRQRIDVRELHISRWSSIKGREPYFNVYVNTSTSQTHGFGKQDSKYLWVLKGPDGETHEISVYESWNFEDIDVDQLLYTLGAPRAWGRTETKRKRVTDFYRNSIKFANSRTGAPPDYFEKHLKAKGFKLLTAMVYEMKFSFRSDYIKESKNSIEFGWMSVGTYNSLPETLKITIRKSNPKYLNLADLGVESAGYYTHCDRMKIRPEDKAEAMQFYRKFKANLKQGDNQ